MIKKIYSLIKKNPLISFFLSFYAATLSVKMIARSEYFYDWDESIYIQIGKEMFEKRSFLFPSWQGQVWLDKPPLGPFLYGGVMKMFYFIKPEISTRLFTLYITVIVLIFIYILYCRITQDKFIAFLTVVATAFTPIFLQRAQVVNFDVFLLLGWLGYIIFFNRFWLAMFFLMMGVLSKSLLGFYPIIMIILYHLYLFWKKKISKQEFKKSARKFIIHFLIAFSWFILMFIIYKQQFFNQHIVESHVKRVTASIESHFGKRTYYIDLIMQEMGMLTWLIIPGLLWIIFQLKKKKIDSLKLLYSVYLFPWFLFLNATKTKISWYIYPAIPQFAYFATIPLVFLQKRKWLFYLSGLVFLGYVSYTALIVNKSYTKQYSSKDSHYALAIYASYRCDKLFVVENLDSRKAYDTLSKLNLVITTTKWFGSHPSIVYYFGKPVDYIYSVPEFKSVLSTLLTDKKNCMVAEKGDVLMESDILKKNTALTARFGVLHLFQAK